MNNRDYAVRSMRSTVLAGAALAAAPSIVQAQAADQGPALEEIIVTAQKREQNIQDVPVSITALSHDAIVANRIQSVTDLSAATPSLTIRPGGGGGRIPQYSIRGISSVRHVSQQIQLVSGIGL